MDWQRLGPGDFHLSAEQGNHAHKEKTKPSTQIPREKIGFNLKSLPNDWILKRVSHARV